MESRDNCGVCGQPLVYETAEVARKCSLCGKEHPSLVACAEGHYICDACHLRQTLDILRNVLSSTASADPIEILDTAISYPSVPMHGPEYHAMVPAIIVTAVKNAGYPVPEGAVDKAVDRGAKVPGGWCGFYGACGAAVGLGIAVSVLTGATPLSGKSRSLANRATAFALGRMLDDGPRCCKRASRRALEAAIEFLAEHLGIKLPRGGKPQCSDMERNRECIRKACPYFPGE